MSTQKNVTLAVIIAIIILLLVIGLVWGLYYALEKTNERQVANQKTNEENEQVVGGDQDEHGCIGSAGYRWCESKSKCLRLWEEGCDDEVFNMFETMSQSAGIDFTNPVQTKLVWQAETETGTASLELNGWVVGASDLSQEEVDKLDDFFKTTDFVIDQYNIAAGTIGSATAYRHDGLGLVCLLSSSFANEEIKSDKHNVTVNCAALDKSQLPQLSTSYQIRKFLATKYGKKISQVAVTIDKETDDYAKGGVKFMGDYGDFGEGGLFLAAKIDGQWEVVWDGNGMISCKLLNSYDFPEDMKLGCADY